MFFKNLHILVLWTKKPNMTGFRCFSKIFASLCFGRKSLRIGRVKEAYTDQTSVIILLATSSHRSPSLGAPSHYEDCRSEYKLRKPLLTRQTLYLPATSSRSEVTVPGSTLGSLTREYTVAVIVVMATSSWSLITYDNIKQFPGNLSLGSRCSSTLSCLEIF